MFQCGCIKHVFTAAENMKTAQFQGGHWTPKISVTESVCSAYFQGFESLINSSCKWTLCYSAEPGLKAHFGNVTFQWLHLHLESTTMLDTRFWICEHDRRCQTCVGSCATFQKCQQQLLRFFIIKINYCCIKSLIEMPGPKWPQNSSGFSCFATSFRLSAHISKGEAVAWAGPEFQSIPCLLL